MPSMIYLMLRSARRVRLEARTTSMQLLVRRLREFLHTLFSRGDNSLLRRRPLIEGARIVDGECEVLGRLRGCGDQADPVRRLEAVPRPLGHDHHHPRFQRVGLRPVLGHDVKGRGADDELWGAVSDDRAV